MIHAVVGNEWVDGAGCGSSPARTKNCDRMLACCGVVGRTRHYRSAISSRASYAKADAWNTVHAGRWSFLRDSSCLRFDRTSHTLHDLQQTPVGRNAWAKG